MTSTQTSDGLTALCSSIQECIAPYAGRVEYGNLRSRISRWDCDGGEPVTNIALVYETPGGSTDQINIAFHHHKGTFALVDAHEGELTTDRVEAVLEAVKPRITGIPEKRRETLFAEIRRQVDGGSATPGGLFGHLNRIMQSEFKGGTITHLELRDAMTFAMQYVKAKSNGQA